MTLSFAPFALDQPTSLRFARVALETRIVEGENVDELFPPLESGIRSSRAMGGLVRLAGGTIGIVVWEPSGPLGVAVRLLYLTPDSASVERYGELVDLIRRTAGPVAFAPGPLAGLSAEEEATVMRARGFENYGRSEMMFRADTVVPDHIPAAGVAVRPVRPTDEAELARLHEIAYRDHLDRYLALEELDPVRDAERQLREYFSGRFGELLSPGSSVALLEGRVSAAVLAVQRPGPPLVIDVMADPAVQGRGLARAALVDALRALRARGFGPVVLNVTEGNDRAIRLYESVGFTRSIGPSFEWYDASRMTVRRPAAYSRPAATPGTGSAAR